jgi:23S rRNA-/tRNA-specific pseudouridylate synthase
MILKILVNDKITNRDYQLKNGDTITHFKHRHEIPVIGDSIEVVSDTDDILAVNKPCSIPMHPCGKYRYNSLALILVKEMNYKNLRSMYTRIISNFVSDFELTSF